MECERPDGTAFTDDVSVTSRSLSQVIIRLQRCYGLIGYALARVVADDARCGPLLSYYTVKDGIWYGAAMVVTADA